MRGRASSAAAAFFAASAWSFKFDQSTDGINWTGGACAHNGSFDDRESMWVDSDPTSAGYGRMYISWNDFTVTCGAGEIAIVQFRLS